MENLVYLVAIYYILCYKYIISYVPVNNRKKSEMDKKVAVRTVFFKILTFVAGICCFFLMWKMQQYEAFIALSYVPLVVGFALWASLIKLPSAAPKETLS